MFVLWSLPYPNMYTIHGKVAGSFQVSWFRVILCTLLRFFLERVITPVMETVKADLPVSWTDTGEPKSGNPLINKLNNRIMTMKALEEAKKKADKGKDEEGRQLLMAQEQIMQNSATSEEIMVQGMLDEMDDMYDRI